MADPKDRPSRKKPAYVYLTELGSSVLGIGVGIVLAAQWPSLLPYAWWIVGVGALLAITGWVCRVWVTEKVP
jgi:hypothetical protein